MLGIYLAFLTWASLAPASVVNKLPLQFPHADKVFHFLIYGGLVAVARWAFAARGTGSDSALGEPGNGTRTGTLVLAAIGYGGLMELAQSLIVSYGRSFEVLDVVANSLGALTFWFISQRLMRGAKAKAAG